MTKNSIQARRRLAFKLASVFLGLVITLLVLELLVRFLTDVKPPLLLLDNEVGRSYAANFDDEIYVAESDRMVRFRTHRDGFRGADVPYQKEKHTYRIAVIGDSQIAAIATLEKDTLVRQLERMLRENHPQVNWEVLNFGISTSSTAQELVLYRKLVRNYDPDLVICSYYIGNDFSDNDSALGSYLRIYMDLDDQGQLYVKPRPAFRWVSSRWLNRYSRLYVWQKGSFAGMTRKAMRTEPLYKVRSGRLIFLDQDRPDLLHAWQLNEALIHQFHKEVTEDKREFLFVVVPSNSQIYQNQWDNFVERATNERQFLDVDFPDRKLGEILDKRNIERIFFREGLRSTEEGQPSAKPEARISYYQGSGHMNEDGNRIAASMVYERLVENGSIEAVKETIGAPLHE